MSTFEKRQSKFGNQKSRKLTRKAYTPPITRLMLYKATSYSYIDNIMQKPEPIWKTINHCKIKALDYTNVIWGVRMKLCLSCFLALFWLQPRLKLRRLRVCTRRKIKFAFGGQPPFKFQRTPSTQRFWFSFHIKFVGGSKKCRISASLESLPQFFSGFGQKN